MLYNESSKQVLLSGIVAQYIMHKV